MRRRKTQILGTEGGGSNPARCFFFPPFSFLFFFVLNPEPLLEPFLFSVFLFGLKLVIRDSQVLAKLGAIYSAFAAFKMAALSG